MEDIKIIKVDETSSTNVLMREYSGEEGRLMTVGVAAFQSAGRGQGENKWESERGKNLTFSIKVYPVAVPVVRQYVMLEAESLAIRDALAGYVDDITIKWPNDIYWKDRKICGMLIENTLVGRCIENCIIGAGININQQTFCSDAPNPVSLRQITGKEQEPVFILADTIKRFKDYYRKIQQGQTEDIVRNYRERLYRHNGFHLYQDADGVFEAEIHDVEPTGHLVLTDRDGTTRRYAFKEVSHLIPSDTTLSAPFVL